MRSQRQLQVGETIRHALAMVFQRGDLPWPDGPDAPIISVTEVQLSPDLRNATVFIMPLGIDETDPIVRALNGKKGFFRHALAGSVKLRYVPTLTFRADNSFEYANNIEKILHDPKVAKDLAKPAHESLIDAEEEA